MFFILFIFVGYLLLTIYLANQQLVQGGQEAALQSLLYIGVVMIFLFALYLLFLSAITPGMVAQLEAEENPEAAALAALEIPTFELIIGLALATLAGGIATTAIISHPARLRLQQALSGLNVRYDAASAVHTTAIVLCMLLLTAQVLTFIASGGADSMAQSIETEGVSPTLPVIQAIFQIVAAFMGVGHLIRRDNQMALQRLGLQTPTRQNIAYGIAGGLFLYGLLIVAGIFVALLTSLGLFPEVDDQAAESLAGAFATIPLALLLATSAAVGEEIFFRGALQPIFGNVLTSIFFAMLHTQSLLSPTIILLFGISMGFGWLRDHHGTYAAIIAHFIYNFIQLLLLILISSSGVV